MSLIVANFNGEEPVFACKPNDHDPLIATQLGIAISMKAGFAFKNLQAFLETSDKCCYSGFHTCVLKPPFPGNGISTGEPWWSIKDELFTCSIIVAHSRISYECEGLCQHMCKIGAILV